MGNYGKPKKIVGRNFRANLLLYSCIILGCYALFNVNKFFIKDFERGYSATGMGYVAFIVIANLFLLLFLILPYILFKTFPKFYFYDEGFTRGKNGAFIYYEKMDYFFIPGLVKGKEFLGRKNHIKKKLEQAMKIIVTRESITFDNEVYEWDKYKIFVNLGNIIVKEQDGTNILSLGPTALIHRPNLLEVIVSTLGKK